MAFNRKFSDEVAGSAAKNQLDCHAILVVSQNRVDGPNHDIKEPRSEGIAGLRRGAPTGWLTDVATLPTTWVALMLRVGAWLQRRSSVRTVLRLLWTERHPADCCCSFSCSCYFSQTWVDEVVIKLFNCICAHTE